MTALCQSLTKNVLRTISIAADPRRFAVIKASPFAAELIQAGARRDRKFRFRGQALRIRPGIIAARCGRPMLASIHD
jgi:hypothetical protein